MASPRRPVPPDIDISAIRGEESIPSAFRAVVGRCGDREAIIDGESSISYLALDGWSNRVATELGAAPDASTPPVLVLADHGGTCVAAMLGVAKAGRSYVVLDPRAPRDYWRTVVERVGAEWVIADDRHAQQASGLGARITLIEASGLTVGADPGGDPDPTGPVSVSFTSGTAGSPKAVVHSHRNVVLNARRVAAVVRGSAADRFLVASPFAFVASATPTFTALLSGAGLLPYEFGTRGVQEFFSVANAAGLTIAQLTPAVLPGLGRYARATGASVDSVRLVMTGGDRLDRRHLTDIRSAFPRADVLHRYSTSETNWVAGLWLDPASEAGEGPVPIGWPVPWVRTRISADGSGEGSGELIVGSSELALGYLADDERTTARFTGSRSQREYHTRDRVREHADGLLEFAGRADATVKVRGVLVDLDVVENVVRGAARVQDAAVVIVVAGGASARVVAFVTGNDVQPREVRRHVAASLPPAMVPADVMLLLDLPLTARGKVDRACLTRLAEALPRTGSAPPADETEASIARAFASVLMVESVGRDDDFFALGGDSLASVELLAVLTGSLGMELGHADLLSRPTPRLLAQAAIRPRRIGSRWESHLVQVSSGGSPSSPAILFSGGGGGHIEGMANIARGLAERTCYVAVPRAFDYRGRPDRSIRAMAASSVADILGLEGVQEVVLIGHSSGGLVAIETARQLVGSDVGVLLVALIDTLANTPDVRHGRRLLPRLRRVVRRNVASRRARGLGSSLPRMAAWVGRVIWGRARLRMQALTAGLVARSRAARLDAFQACVKVALLRHHEGDYQGQVLVLRAERPTRGVPTARTGDLGWPDCITGPVSVMPGRGGHLEMVRPPYAALAAGQIADMLTVVATENLGPQGVSGVAD